MPGLVGQGGGYLFVVTRRKEPAGKRPLKTLERVISKAGLGSRVEARAWIGDGRVAVNGRVIRDPDHWVDMERDRVRFDGKPLTARERVYVLLYKPTGYLTTYKDPEGRPTVYDLLTDVGTFVIHSVASIARFKARSPAGDRRVQPAARRDRGSRRSRGG